MWIDSARALLFYFVFSAFALIGMPLTRRLLGPVPAYIAGKSLGLLMFAYVVWLGGSLHVLDYQRTGLITTLYGAGLAAGAYLLRERFTRADLIDLLRFEGVSCLLYLAYLLLRSFHVDIYGTERFMDMMLLTSAGKTHWFPFIDGWYAGRTVNYYYYGSYLVSLLAKLSGTPYVLAYTCALTLTFVSSCVTAGAIAYEYTLKKRYAVLAAFLVTTAGTIFFAIKTFLTAGTYPYQSSTRLYTPSYIINEIPSYSFTVGDLHAHMLALPFFLCNLLLLGALAKSDKPYPTLCVLTGLGLGSTALINAWDGITLSLVVLLIVLWKVRLGWRWSLAGLAIAAEAGLLVMPFLLNFKSPVLGLGFSPAFVAAHHLHDVQYPSPLAVIAGVWGAFLLGIMWAVKEGKVRPPQSLFPWVLAICSVLILVGVEVVFVPDIYSVANPPYFRGNTVFKFGYHAWTMLALAFTMMVPRPKPHPIVLVLLGVFLAASCIYPYQAIKQYYVDQSTGQSLDGAKFMHQEGPGDYQALQYINTHLLDRSVLVEAAGDSYKYFGRMSAFTGMESPVNWLTHEWTWRLDAKAAKIAGPGQQVETGYGAIVKISQDVQTIYETQDPELARSLLKKYGAQYVYIGALERATYTHLQERNLLKLGNVVFRCDNTVLIELGTPGDSPVQQAEKSAAQWRR